LPAPVSTTAGQVAEGLLQIRDQYFVEGIVFFRPVHGYGGNPPLIRIHDHDILFHQVLRVTF
jgi:hypothetical protein